MISFRKGDGSSEEQDQKNVLLTRDLVIREQYHTIGLFSEILLLAQSLIGVCQTKRKVGFSPGENELGGFGSALGSYQKTL